MMPRMFAMKRAAFVAALAVLPAAAASAQLATCPTQGQGLITMPEIRSDSGKLRATLVLADTVRLLWGSSGDTRCAQQRIRYLRGSKPGDKTPWPATPEPIPGPTFRSRLGDLVEIAFFNQINTNNFANALDRGDVGHAEACDQYTYQDTSGKTVRGAAGGDKMPNCLHGSSTTNVHFHGTHTTPSTTGDNVLLFIRPANRTGGKLRPADEALATQSFASVFKSCETKGPPKLWTDLPAAWQTAQKALLMEYDRTAAYQGKIGALPDSSKLWPYDSHQIMQGLWPQYQIGANPYCFPLPKYNPATMRMGQSPGTMWYHAHKHGSTALNVANSLTGAFIIAGEYDDTLHAYYGPNFREQVLMIQQIGSAPFALTNPITTTNNFQGPGSIGRPPLSVNGRINPRIGMIPGEVQMWRIINGAFRDAVNVGWFVPAGSSCGTTAPPQTMQWRQIAQDGVQFHVKTYATSGAINRAFNLAPANRADLLVKAPALAGEYSLCVSKNNGVLVQVGAPAGPEAPSVLLSVSVSGTTLPAPQQFIPDARFPIQPTFLADIPDSAIKLRRELVFEKGNTFINGRAFEDHVVDQTMTLNTAEEWTIKNEANDKSHPFHIHINPFQITELFEPNSKAATTPGDLCYVDPNNPATWKPCASAQPKAPFVWWDVFAIPSGQQIPITAQCKPKNPTGPADTLPTLVNCPAQLQKYTKCVKGNPPTPGPATSDSCTEYIAGSFTMRTRFVDFTGLYVLHCHILIHEDRGMMQLIEVVPGKTPYGHH